MLAMRMEQMRVEFSDRRARPIAQVLQHDLKHLADFRGSATRHGVDAAVLQRARHGKVFDAVVLVERDEVWLLGYG